MVVLNGLYFALRSGSEHRNLRSDPCQIQLIEKPGHRPTSNIKKTFLRTDKVVLKDERRSPKQFNTTIILIGVCKALQTVSITAS